MKSDYLMVDGDSCDFKVNCLFPADDPSFTADHDDRPQVLGCDLSLSESMLCHGQWMATFGTLW